MQARADISLYPLADDFIPPIRDVIERLRARDGLDVVTNPVSTQVSGDYDAVMDALRDEVAESFRRHGKAVFVIKLLHLTDPTPG
jgi:uncharacterized protein YqgV (UPF0045/DUF77 family)